MSHLMAFIFTVHNVNVYVLVIYFFLTMLFHTIKKELYCYAETKTTSKRKTSLQTKQ